MTIDAEKYTYGIEIHDPFGDDYFYLGHDEVLHSWLVKPIAADAFATTSAILLALPEGYYAWNESVFRAEDGLPKGLTSLGDTDNCIRVSVGSSFDDKAHAIVGAMDEVSGQYFDLARLDEDRAYSITQY